MRLLAWNIRHGGGRRIEGIRSALQRHDAAAVVLCEYRGGGSGARLRGALEAIGYRHATTIEPPAGRNGVLDAARCRFREHGAVSGSVPEPHRMLQVAFPSFHLIGVYLPNQWEKVPYWEAILSRSKVLSGKAAVVLGDFNTTRHFLDEIGDICVTSAYMDGMEQAGFSDVWRRRYPERREYSWFSTRGRGFRIDHAFFSKRLAPLVETVRYSHDEREAGLSDHSIIVIDLELPGPSNVRIQTA